MSVKKEKTSNRLSIPKNSVYTQKQISKGECMYEI